MEKSVRLIDRSSTRGKKHKQANKQIKAKYNIDKWRHKPKCTCNVIVKAECSDTGAYYFL